MIYNKYDLLELFESFPEFLVDEITGISTYTRQDMYGFTFRMFLDVHEGHCVLTLLYKDFEYPIFRGEYRDVKSITCKENRLIIHQYDKLEDTVVHFKPTYGIMTEAHIPL
jgi:hypothetical protein